jgi:hypothetical protein
MRLIDDSSECNFLDDGPSSPLMGPAIADIGGRKAEKAVLIPHCLWAGSNPLCECLRTGLLVADDVCPGDCVAAHYRSEARQLRECT